MQLYVYVTGKTLDEDYSQAKLCLSQFEIPQLTLAKYHKDLEFLISKILVPNEDNETKYLFMFQDSAYIVESIWDYDSSHYTITNRFTKIKTYDILNSVPLGEYLERNKINKEYIFKLIRDNIDKEIRLLWASETDHLDFVDEFDYYEYPSPIIAIKDADNGYRLIILRSYALTER